MDNHRLGIIVPYRNRKNHLTRFLTHMVEFFERKEIDYRIIVVEQDNARQFNRGMLLNIGFKYSIELNCNYVVFHDVDMLPIDVDYSYSDVPIHLATDFILQNGDKPREIFDEYFGGVTMFPSDVFSKINGYSNKYWDWGYEDSDLFFRCKLYGVKTDTKKYKNQGIKKQALKFNGFNSYVECFNTISLNNNSTFIVTFYPDEFILDHTKQSDEFTVFSIPGWDFAISYNSFSRYNFCLFDSEKMPFFINTKIKPKYKTTIAVVLDRNENISKLYQDGIFIGQTNKFKRLYPYKKELKFYLGAGNPNRNNMPNFFRGTISNFAYFDSMLGDKEILEIINNPDKTLKKNFGDYKTSHSLKIYYDAAHIENYELVDLVGNNNGKIINSEIIEEKYDDYLDLKVPYRRHSKFRSLKHDDNGFFNGAWKSQATRWNQLRFHNEVSLNTDLIINDGLSDLNFYEYGRDYKNNILHVNVGI